MKIAIFLAKKYLDIYISRWSCKADVAYFQQYLFNLFMAWKLNEIRVYILKYELVIIERNIILKQIYEMHFSVPIFLHNTIFRFICIST